MADPKEPSLSEVQAGGHREAGDGDDENQRRDAAEVDNE
jgi:hypothetical protein